MPRENSFSDEDRSITPDLDESERVASPHAGGEPAPALPSPVSAPNATHAGVKSSASVPLKSPTSQKSHHSHFPSRTHVAPQVTYATPTDHFRAAVRKVMHMHRSASYIQGVIGVGAEPGVDPRRESATQAYGHIQEDCLIEVMDYSSVRHSFGRMTNKEFIDLLADHKASKPEKWVKVRWINIGGISW